MDLREAIRTRRSVRACLPKPVPQETIIELINDAIRSPSWANTQSWEIVVVTGETLEQFKKQNRRALIKGETSFPEITVPKDWPDTLKKRRIDLGQSVLDALSIERDDIQGRMA
jgi:nitroreductase